MSRQGATRASKPQDFDYPARARQRQLGNKAYGQLWPIVDGAVSDALKSHPDYLTPKGHRSARTSIVKRVTGTVIGFAEQSAKGRGNAAEKEDGPVSVAPQATAPARAEAGAGASTRQPHPFNCRIGKITLKPSSEEARLRDQNIELGTRVLVLEDLVANRRPQLRDAEGRFASRRGQVAAQLVAIWSNATPEQRSAARSEALRRSAGRG